MQTILGIILIVASLFLVAVVLLQNGKAHNLSGAIAGGAETFFGKSKSGNRDKLLSTLTTVVAVVFCLLVVVAYVFQDNGNSVVADNGSEVVDTTAEEIADTTAEEVADTTAEEVADTTAEEVADTAAEEVADTTAEV